MGCRSKRPADELVRITVVGGSIVIGQRAGGRGAYVCPSSQCVNSAEKRRALPRALRTEVPPEAYESLRREIADETAFSSDPSFVKR